MEVFGALTLPQITNQLRLWQSMLIAAPPGSGSQYLSNFTESLVGGYFFDPPRPVKIQMFIIIAIHFAEIFLALGACWLRTREDSFWLFRKVDGYILPNTPLFANMLSVLYCILFIIWGFAGILGQVPSVGTYSLQILAYVPLATAIHFQIWSTTNQIPNSTFTFASPSNSSKLSILSNLFFILLLFSFFIFSAFSTYVIGSSYHRFLIAIDYLKSRFEWILSDPSNEMVFQQLTQGVYDLVESGKNGISSAWIMIRIASVWAGIYTVGLFLSSLSLWYALAKHEKRLVQGLSNLRAVDALVTHSHSELQSSFSTRIQMTLFRTSASFSIRRPSVITLSGMGASRTTPDLKPVAVAVSPPHSSRSEKPTIVTSLPLETNHRTEIQQLEMEQKLEKVRTLKQTLILQFIPAFLTAMGYIVVVVYVLSSPNFMDQLVYIRVWFGWLFCVCGPVTTLITIRVSLQARSKNFTRSLSPAHTVTPSTPGTTPTRPASALTSNYPYATKPSCGDSGSSRESLNSMRETRAGTFVSVPLGPPKTA